MGAPSDTGFFKSFLIARPGALLFFLLLTVQLVFTRFAVAKSERELPPGNHYFSGVITDPGVILSEDPGQGRTQTVRLDNGIRALLWLEQPGKRGDRVSGTAVFTVGEGTRNPGGYSKRNYLLSKGALWEGRPRSVKLLPQSGFFLSVRRLPDRLRDYFRTRFDSVWQSPKGPLLLSLSLGDTRLLEEREKYELQTAGLSHLTSVSGTHLLFITGPSERFFKKLRLSSRMRTILMIFILLLPGILSGWKSGICRASLISLFRMADRPLMRRRDAYNTLFFVGSVLLLFNAYALYDTGFWMSFMTAAAVSFMSELQDKKEGQGKKGGWVASCRASFLFSIAAQTAILPYQMMSSPGIHLLAPLANVIALPLASILMASCYLFLFLLLPFSNRSVIYKAVSALFLFFLNGLSSLFQWIARTVTRMRLAFVPLKYVLLFLPLIVLVVLLMKRRNFVLKYKKILLFSFTLCLAFVLLFFVSFSKTSFLFLDVGQGDATLLVKKGHALLVDGGDKGHGYHTVIPALRMQAISAIDLVILTHAHSDHASGVMELMEAGVVRAVCMPVRSDENIRTSSQEEDMTEALETLASDEEIALYYLKTGDVIDWRGVQIEVLSPDDKLRGDLNDRSLVLSISLEGIRVLMTGDLTEATERYLLRSDFDFSADLLHVAHHGSRYATTDAFLLACDPETAVISVGAHNRYGHPHPDVIRRLERRSIEPIRTDESGCVFLNIRRQKGTINTWIR